MPLAVTGNGEVPDDPDIGVGVLALAGVVALAGARLVEVLERVPAQPPNAAARFAWSNAPKNDLSPERSPMMVSRPATTASSAVRSPA